MLIAQKSCIRIISMVLIKITAGINRHHIIADHQSRAGLCQQLTGKVVSTVCKRSRFFYTVMVNRKIVFCKKNPYMPAVVLWKY